MFPDVHVAVGAPDDLRTRALAASLLVPGAVVGGYAAAELLEASCGPADAAVDLVVGRHRTRPRRGLLIRQDVLRDDEVVEVDGVRVTTPVRTAVDLACRLDHVEAVVAVDALARVGRFAPEQLLTQRPGARGTRRLPQVVAEADPRAGSPPETRTRLALLAQGVPPADLQVEVFDALGLFVGRVDLGWRRARVGVEYQGDHHRTDVRQWRRDQARLAALAAAGWLILPATALALRRPDVLAEQVLDALAARSR